MHIGISVLLNTSADVSPDGCLEEDERLLGYEDSSSSDPEKGACISQSLAAPTVSLFLLSSSLNFSESPDSVEDDINLLDDKSVYDNALLKETLRSRVFEKTQDSPEVLQQRRMQQEEKLKEIFKSDDCPICLLSKEEDPVLHT